MGLVKHRGECVEFSHNSELDPQPNKTKPHPPHKNANTFSKEGILKTDLGRGRECGHRGVI